MVSALERRHHFRQILLRRKPMRREKVVFKHQHRRFRILTDPSLINTRRNHMTSPLIRQTSGLNPSLRVSKTPGSGFVVQRILSIVQNLCERPLARTLSKRHNIPGIEGILTPRLVAAYRSSGRNEKGCQPISISIRTGPFKKRVIPRGVDASLVQNVTAQNLSLAEGPSRSQTSSQTDSLNKKPNTGVAAYDFGIKTHLLRYLVERLR